MQDEIDLNTAGPEELGALPGMGPDRTWDVMRHRPYRNWSDVEAVPGMTPQMIEVLQRAGAVIRFEQTRAR
jgi:DNA uptake protein ComE-like DNA-binding protein